MNCSLFVLSYWYVYFKRGVDMKNTMIDQYYKKILSSVDAELLTLPAGRLVIRGTRYYHLVNGKEIGITRNTKLIRLLCRKKYLLVLKKLLEKNTSSKSINKLVSIMPEEIIRSLPTSYQMMPISYFYHPSVEKWLAKPPRENTYKGRKYKISDDVVVRSKSEYMIASLLEEYKSPYNFLYLYEPAVTLNGQTKYPDFSIIDLFTGKILIWEHFGALHIPEYAQEMNKKMEQYLENGYVPFETIIYTFEFDMNTQRLKNLIENVILS